MHETPSRPAPFAGSDHAAILAAQAEHCEDCLGAGGWYRYEPSAELAPGVLYLSCLHCRGSGRMVFPVA